MRIKYTILEKTNNYIRLGVSEVGDHVVHIIKSGTKDSKDNRLWMYFIEDAYQLEPYNGNGVKLKTLNSIGKLYNIIL